MNLLGRLDDAGPLVERLIPTKGDLANLEKMRQSWELVALTFEKLRMSVVSEGIANTFQDLAAVFVTMTDATKAEWEQFWDVTRQNIAIVGNYFIDVMKEAALVIGSHVLAALKNAIRDWQDSIRERFAKAYPFPGMKEWAETAGGPRAVGREFVAPVAGALVEFTGTLRTKLDESRAQIKDITTAIVSEVAKGTQSISRMSQSLTPQQLTQRRQSYSRGGSPEVTAAIEAATEAASVLKDKMTKVADNVRVTIADNVRSGLLAGLQAGKQGFLDFFKTNILTSLTSMMAESVANALLRGAAGGQGGLLDKALGFLFGRGGAGLVPAAQHGANWMVGGRGGVDNNLVAFRASRGENIIVRTPQQQRDARGGGAIMIEVNQSFPGDIHASSVEELVAVGEAAKMGAENAIIDMKLRDRF